MTPPKFASTYIIMAEKNREEQTGDNLSKLKLRNAIRKKEIKISSNMYHPVLKLHQGTLELQT